MSNLNILASSPSIIYRPGGSPGGLVVTTWAQVQKFIAARQSAVIVYVDDSLAPCHVPAASGITDCQGRVEIRPYRQDAENFSTLVIDPGAQLKSLYKLSGTIFLECNPTGATPSLDFDYSLNVLAVAPFPMLYIEDQAALGTAPTASTPACVVPVNQQLNVLMTNFAAIFAGSASAIFQLSAGTVLLFSSRNSVFESATGSIPPTWVQGTGKFELSFDAGTINYTNLSGTVIGPGVSFTNATTNELVAVDGDTNTYPGGLTSTGLSIQTAFVRANGSDTHGNGSREFPYATVQKAFDSIVDASITKRYVIDIGPGEFPDPFNFRPWVAIQGHPNGSGFQGVTEITAGAGTIGFDPLFAAAGLSLLWASNLVLANQLTLDYSLSANQSIQGTFLNVDFNGGFQFIGAGRAGLDNWTLDNCLVYGGGLAQGVQFLFTIGGTQFLGGTVTIQSAPSAAAVETTTWLAQNTAVGSAFSPTNVHVLWVAPTPPGFPSKLDWCNSNCVGQINLDGVNTSAKITGLRPANVIQSNGAPPAIVQPLTIEIPFTAAGPSHNVLAVFQTAGILPSTGSVRVDIEGFGGAGGGGGGEGGGAGPAVGGGGSGGCVYQVGSFDFDLSHELDIDVGTGGSGGTGGPAGNGAGLNGTDGAESYAYDHNATVTVFVLAGSSGGQGATGIVGPGRGGANYPGQNYIPAITDPNGPAYGSGFQQAGGRGGVAGVPGTNGQSGLTSINVPGTGTSWTGGTGGTSGVGLAGGGGGGGQGIFASGAAGGNAQPGGNPGGDGGTPAANTGAGAGGGSGGTNGTDVGGAGGTGSTGFVKIRIIVQ
jgi:hypothetical protein